MKSRISELWRRDGEISRAPFVRWAVLLFLLKYNLDRALVAFAFDRDWSIFSYFSQPVPGLQNLSPANSAKELLILLAASLPFLWMGVLLCMKRLRSARLPLWMAVLFVVPIVKWFLFVALALVPARVETEGKEKPGISWLPKSVFSSAALAVALTMFLAFAAILLSTQVFGQYGWGLFAGIPFSTGSLSALILGSRQERSVRESVTVACLSVALTGAILLGLAFEGVVCLLMAAPLAFALTVSGALAGHMAMAGLRPRVPPQVYCISVLAVPLMLGTE